MVFIPRQAELPDGTRLRNFSLGSDTLDINDPGFLQWQTVDADGIATHWNWRYSSFTAAPDNDLAYNEEILVLRFEFVGDPEVIATTDLRVPLPSLLPENRY